MARYNTIWAGPDSENMPQKVEAPASAKLMPGLIATLTAGKLAPAAATAAGALYVVQDNYLTMKNVDQEIAVDDVVMGLIMLDEQLFNLRFATGISVVKGASISLGADGAPVLSTAGSRVIGYADETYNNTSGETQLVRVRAIAGYRLAA